MTFDLHFWKDKYDCWTYYIGFGNYFRIGLTKTASLDCGWDYKFYDRLMRKVPGFDKGDR